MRPGQITQEERKLSATNLREPIGMLLAARPEGLGEAMLVHLVRAQEDVPLGALTPAYVVSSDDRWVDKVRTTCRLLGARRDEQGVWSLA